MHFSSFLCTLKVIFVLHTFQNAKMQITILRHFRSNILDETIILSSIFNGFFNVFNGNNVNVVLKLYVFRYTAIYMIFNNQNQIHLFSFLYSHTAKSYQTETIIFDTVLNINYRLDILSYVRNLDESQVKQYYTMAKEFLF